MVSFDQCSWTRLVGKRALVVVLFPAEFTSALKECINSHNEVDMSFYIDSSSFRLLHMLQNYETFFRSRLSKFSCLFLFYIFPLIMPFDKSLFSALGKRERRGVTINLLTINSCFPSLYTCLLALASGWSAPIHVLICVRAMLKTW